MLRLIFWPVLAPSLLFAMGVGAVAPVSVLAALGLGASAPLASAIVALAGIVSLGFTVPAGIIIDRIGDRRSMILATAAAVVVTGLTVLSLVWQSPLSLPLFVISIVLRAPVSDVWSLARQAIVAETVPTWQLGRAMTALGGTMRAGTLVGPLIGGALLLWLPLWSVYVFSALCACFAVIVMNIPALNGGFDARAEAARRRSRRTEQQEPGAGEDAKREPLAVRWRAVVLAGVSITALAVCRVAQPIIVQLWGHSLGLTESAISLIVAGGAAIELVMMFPGAYIKDLLGRAPALIACLAVYGLGFALTPLMPTLGGLIIAVVVMSLGNGLGAGVNMTIGADLSPAVGRARFLGIWAIFSNAGMLGGPALIALLVGVASIPTAILAVGGVAAFGAVWMALFARRIALPKGVRSPGSTTTAEGDELAAGADAAEASSLAATEPGATAGLVDTPGEHPGRPA